MSVVEQIQEFQSEHIEELVAALTSPFDQDGSEALALGIPEMNPMETLELYYMQAEHEFRGNDDFPVEREEIAALLEDAYGASSTVIENTASPQEESIPMTHRNQYQLRPLTEPKPSIWAVCHLRLAKANWVELAGVPAASAEQTIARLKDKGVKKVTIAGRNQKYTVIRFMAKAQVIAELAEAFPTACKYEQPKAEVIELKPIAAMAA